MAGRTPEQVELAKRYDDEWSLVAKRITPATDREREAAGKAIVDMMARHNYHGITVGWTRSVIEATLLGGLLGARIELGKPIKIKPDPDGWYPTLRDLWGQDISNPSDGLHYWYSGNMKAAIAEMAEDKDPKSEAQNTVRACLREAWRLVNGGNQWSAWPAFAQFERDVMKADADFTDLDDYMTCARNAGPRFMHTQFVIFSDFPETLKLDEEGRIHSAEGPFATWRDGSKMYADHARRIPRWVGEPTMLNADRIKAETNAEYRRIAIEKYGWSRYLKETGAKVIDMDGGLDLQGSACRILMEDSNGDRVLIGTDGSTKRVYSMRVPREAKTCAEAHKMISGFDEKLIVAEC